MGADLIPHEMLLRHAGFLRRLAHDLVGDWAAADDAVQEVWVRALERPPRRSSNLRGWLRVMLTNLVRTKARNDARRESRERERANERGQDALAPRSEDEAILRSVTEAVLALEEPLRATVLQHYFQDLTTAEIAKRENLPASTVKSRLQRALEILRARMERKHRGDERSWRSSLLALALRDRALRWGPHAAPAAKAGTGVLLMTLKMKIALGCAAVLAAVFAYRGLTSRPGGSSEPLASSGPVASTSAPKAAPSGKPALETVTKPSERAAGAAPAEIPAAARNERPATLFYGSLLDPAGRPLTGLWSAGVSLTDADGRRRYGDAKDGGSFAFNALPYGKYWVTAGADGFRAAEDVIDLEAGHAQIQKDITLQPVPILKIRVVTPEGENLFDVLRGDTNLSGHPVLVPVATKDRPGKWFNEVVGSLNNTFGIGHFWNYGPRVQALPSGCMGILMLDQELPAYVSLVNYHRVVQTKEVMPGEEEVRFVVSLDDLMATLATIHVQVVDADTQTPLAGANAMLWGGTYMDTGKRSDSSGNIVFEGREPGEFDLHVRAKGYEEYKAHILADSGTTTDLGQIALDKEIQLEAKVVDGSGAPRSERFSLGTFDPATHKLTMEQQRAYQSGGGGLLKLDGLGRRVYVLRTANHDAVNDQDNPETKWVSGDVLVDLRSGTAPANFVVSLVPATRMMIAVKGEPAEGLRFIVMDEQGLDLVSSRFYGTGPRPLTLPQGKYRVALLDANKTVLKEQSVTLGATAQTLELSR
jgi:RNA polymerase sigma-70 factor (ECF subfamily)